MTVKIEKDKRRYYLIGDTFSIKEQLKNDGCHWDPNRRAWWTSKKDVAKKYEGQDTPAHQQDNETLDPDARVIAGRAKYKGRTYYFLVHGERLDGTMYTKLAFRDGSRVFWAARGERVTILAEYHEKRSINYLREYAEKMKKAGEGEKFRQGGMCDECGEHPATTTATDMSGITGRVCGICAQDSHHSFC